MTTENNNGFDLNVENITADQLAKLITKWVEAGQQGRAAIVALQQPSDTNEESQVSMNFVGTAFKLATLTAALQENESFDGLQAVATQFNAIKEILKK